MYGNLIKKVIYSFSEKIPVYNSLITLRHGQSIWNKIKQWAGWTDVPLSQQGIEESIECAKLLKLNDIKIDEAYVSVMKRTIQTLNYILDELDCHYIPVHKSWRLNEKHYGQLQGEYKAQISKKFSEEKVIEWRRSMDISPPKVQKDDKRHPIHDRRYQGVNQQQLPDSQCLNDVIKRFLSLYRNQIQPKIKLGKKILIVTHGSILRSLLHILYEESSENIKKFNVPNVTPLFFDFDKNMKPIGYHLLGNKTEIQDKMRSIANQIKVTKQPQNQQ